MSGKKRFPRVPERIRRPFEALVRPYSRETVALTLWLVLLSAGYVIWTFSLSETLSRIHMVMAWNLFLADLPLLFALLAVRRYHIGSARPFLMLYGLLWLFFFPNAPYLVTDFIHLTQYSYYGAEAGSSLAFSADLTAWLGLCHIALVAVIGLGAGMLSLYLFHDLFRRKYGNLVGWLFVVGISLMSGIAIFIGRFLRFNSWDFFTQPAYLLTRLTMALSPQTVGLSFLFAILTLVPYLLFYASFDRAR